MSDRFTRFAALVAILALGAAAPASAQTSPTCDAYCGPQGQVLGDFNGGGQEDVIPPPAKPAPAGGGEAPDRGTPTRAVPVERGADAPAPTTPSVSKGSLPFTGFEAGIVALLGVALLGVGFAMRRGTRSPA
jgi:hypothetical protein